MAGRGKLIRAFLRGTSISDDSTSDSGSSHASRVDLLLTEIPEKPSTSGRGRLSNTFVNQASSSSALNGSAHLDQFQDAEDSDSADQEHVYFGSQATSFRSEPAIRTYGTREKPDFDNVLPTVDDIPNAVSPEAPKVVEPINTITNHVRLLRAPNYDLYLYELNLEPKIDDYKIIRKIFESTHVKSRFKATPLKLGDNIFLPTNVGDFTLYPIPYPDKPGEYIKMTVHFIKQLSLQEQLVPLNCLFKRIRYILNSNLMRSKYFDEDQRINLEEWLMEIWPGDIIDIGLSETGVLTLSCDISHRVLHKTNVYYQLELLMPNERFHQVARRHLIGSSVITTYNKQKYRIDDIDFDTNPNSVFVWGQMSITYVDYFKEHWNIQIKHLDQPLLVHRKYSSKTSSYRLIYLVPEMCHTTGQSVAYDRKSYVKLVLHEEPPASIRYHKLLKFLCNVQNNEAITDLLREWGLTLDASSHTMLSDKFPEDMVISNEENIGHFINQRLLKARNMPSNWFHLLRNSLLAPVTIGNKWVVIFQRSDKFLVQGFIYKCLRFAKTLSIKLDTPRCVDLLTPTTDAYLCAVRNNYSTEDKIMVIVTPANIEIKQRYDRIKHYCTVNLGIATQFIRGGILAQPRKMEIFCPNLLVQMICKMGGAPWGVQMPLNKVMYVGIDVYHREKSGHQKSVIGFVATTDSNATHWFSKAFIRHDNASDIADESLMEAMTESLYKYRAMNNHLPSYIIIYREDDGVECEKFCKIEYPMLVSAIRDVYTLDDLVVEGEKSENPTLDDNGNLMPYIVFMTVAKLISAKLFIDETEDEILDPRTLLSAEQQPEKFLIDLSDQEEKKSRVTIPPSGGTILTTSAERFEQFHLVSQKTDDTCACPIRVRVLRNSGTIRSGTIRATEAEENQPEVVGRLTSQFLQSVSYKLCHLYYNTTSICRQPAPGMYAQKVANFVGEHLENVASEDLEDKLFYL